MAGAFRGVLRLLHGTQRQSADHCFFRRPFDPSQKFLDLLWMNLIPHSLHAISKITDKHGQLLNLLRIGIFVAAVHKRYFLPEEVLRHGLIGDQHKILNELCCSVPVIGLYLLGNALLI